MREKSIWAKPGWFISALSRVLTAVITVNSCVCSSLMKAGKSRGLVTSTLCPPYFMNTRQFTVSENT